MGRRALAFALGLLAAAGEARAIPAFARRQRLTCSACHDAFPALNQFGRQYLERGFRDDADEASASPRRWAGSVPASAWAQWTDQLGDSVDPPVLGFGRASSAGALGARVSYWLNSEFDLERGYDVRRRQPALETSQDWIDEAWIRVEIVPRNRLHLRAGRFPPDLPISQARSPDLFSYELYQGAPGFERDAIGDGREGVEMGGGLRGGHWSAGVFRGRNRPDFPATFTEGRERVSGLLRFAAHRSRHSLGAFLHAARHAVEWRIGPPSARAWTNDSFEAGVSVHAWLARADLSALLSYGRGDDPASYEPLAYDLRLGTAAFGERTRAAFGGGMLGIAYKPSRVLRLTGRAVLLSRPWSSLVRGGGRSETWELFPGARIELSRARCSLELALRFGIIRENATRVRCEAAF